MSAASIARSVARMMAVHGETMVLKRASEATTITLKGKRLAGSTVDIGGSAVQQEFRVKIGTSELSSSAWTSKAPGRHDSIIVDGRERSILDVRPLSDGGTVALYELLVAG